MQPPSRNNKSTTDSILDYLQELTIQPRLQDPVATLISTTAPPPPYTLVIPTPGSDYDDDDEEYDDYDDDGDHLNTTNHHHNISRPNTRLTNISNTIIININSSVKIKGDGNIIATPSSQPQIQRNLYRNTDNNPRPKLANTTAAILTALQHAGVLSPTSNSTSRSFTPANLKIKIDAGIKVDGSRNVVCLGSVATAPGVAYRTGDLGRKRRAESEPIGEEDAKRYKKG
ncbi:hypothetical protein BJX70DRAFT_404602 [Aspergillus crustosus]